jgi:hypothetical protein
MALIGGFLLIGTVSFLIGGLENAKRHLTEGVMAEIQNVPGVSRALPAPLIHSPVEDPLIDGPDLRVGSGSQAA